MVRRHAARDGVSPSRRRVTVVLAAAVLASASWLGGDLPRSGAATTHQPLHDAHVAAKSPDRNYGTSATLVSDRSPVFVTYLMFDLSGLTQPVSGATLRMYKTSGSGGLQTIWNVEDDSWTEATLTYRNRPARGTAAATFVPGTASGSWVEVDVTAAVAAAVGTLLSLSIDSTSSDGYDFKSKEAASDRVELVVEPGPVPPPPSTTTTATTTTTTTTTTTSTTTAPTTTTTTAPTTTTTTTLPLPPPPPGSDPVIVAAGDVACPGKCGQDETAALIDVINPAAVLGLGDYQYEYGTLANLAAYYEPHWGRFKARTYPASGGSHDFYGTGEYLAYFNAGGPVVLQPEGSYSFDIGAWHMVALNSYCFERASCDEVAVTNWLIADLAAHPAPCTLAYFHQPYWTSPSSHNRTLTTKPWIQVLFDAGADVVLQAHNHGYERFAPQTPDDVPDDTRGLTAFTVGTGGRSHYAFSGAAANSLVRNSDTFGVLELTLHASGYDFRFVPEPGKAFTDSGTGSCH